MDKVNKEQYTFTKFLKTKATVKIYFALAFFFAAYNADSFTYFVLKLLFLCLCSVGFAFFDYKMFRRKLNKGEVIEILGHNLTKKNNPNLFKVAQENQAALTQKIQKYADMECDGNISLAIDLLEREKKL